MRAGKRGGFDGSGEEGRLSGIERQTAVGRVSLTASTRNAGGNGDGLAALKTFKAGIEAGLSIASEGF